MLPLILAMVGFFTTLGIYSAILAYKNASIGHTDLSFPYYMVSVTCLLCLIAFIIIT